MFFDEYPYTNLHNVNLDWVLQAVKAWGALVEQNNIAFHNLEEANEDFKNYVTSYLENLDVQEEINNKLDSMSESGVLTQYMQPYISSSVTTWLDENITQPVGVVIDSSLTVAGACADAKKTGDEIRAIKTNLSALNEITSDNTNIVNFSDGTVVSNGVTFTKDALNRTVTTSGSHSGESPSKCDLMTFKCNYTGVYYVSGCPSGGGTLPPYYRIGLWDSSLHVDHPETGNGLFLTLNAGTNYSLYIQANGEGLNMNGYVFKPSIINVSDYNIAKFESGTVTSQGVTFTKNATNKTVTTSGYVSGSGTAKCDLFTFTPSETGTYYISGCPSGGGTSEPYYHIGVWNTASQTDMFDTGDGILATFTANVRYPIYIQAKGLGLNMDRLVFHPSIIKAKDYSNDDLTIGGLNSDIQVIKNGIRNAKQVVNILDLGGKNDGSIDVGAIINANTANASIFLPVGKYKITTPIVLVNSLIGEAHIRDYTSGIPTKGATVLISGLESGAVITLEENSLAVTISNINIYCNSDENAISLGIRYRLCNLENIGINNLGNAIGILRSARGSRNLYANNISIFAKPLKASTGIKITNGSDDRLTNIEIMFCQIGLDISGTVFGSNIHVWTGAIPSQNPTHTWFIDTVGLLCSGAFYGANIFLDTAYNFIYSKNGKIWINNLLTWDDIVASQYENKLFLVKTEGDSYLRINGGSYRDGRTDISMLSESEAVNFIGL